MKKATTTTKKTKTAAKSIEGRINGRLTEIAEERTTNGRSQATWIPEGVFKPRIGIDISRAVGEPITGVGRSCLTMLKCLADMPDDVVVKVDQPVVPDQSLREPACQSVRVQVHQL